ncbi:pyridoxal-dependent decarboxylase domain protein [Ancylostoma caninum]|uniref:Aromatic-L-amino-acid decarboxylase n=1 Tax=Ancylostoma caninum TaxID=29170 RepID=A0A368G9P2_ANCCA|nr:pyridoxal-dependent decarboxylase domain protein [Ancylostoma caninum]
MLCGVRLRKLKTTLDPELKNYNVTREVLEEAIKEDRARGLIPFILIATMGTTSSCSIDRLDCLGPICDREHIWLHVDAAYAGLCIQAVSRYHRHKDTDYSRRCHIFRLKDGTTAAKYFNVDPVYLKHEHQAVASDYRHLQVALGRRFRALKIWFVLRKLGIAFLQTTLRRAGFVKHFFCGIGIPTWIGQNQQAALFAKLINDDQIFELFVPQHLGLVCFRIKNSSNEENEALCTAINEDRRIHLVPSKVHGTFFLRLSICSQLTTDDDVRFAYEACRDVFKHLKNNS